MGAPILGVSFSGDELYGALVERTDEGGIQVRFTVSSADPDKFEPELPGGDDFSQAAGTGGPSGFDGEEDVNIQFGDNGGQGGPGIGDAEESDGGEDAVALIQSQLNALLDACANRGYEDPEIALCSPVGEIDDVELRLPAADGSADSSPGEGDPLPAKRSVLLAALEDQYEGVVEDDRVGFLPLPSTEDDCPRVLALIARPGGPVLSTLASMEEQTLSRRLRVALLETEVSLYEGLARLTQTRSAVPDETTAVVRVGIDDTVVLFLRGDTLLKFEYLPELTAEDPVETVCSRVLLLRDEYGVGQIHTLLLALEENEDQLKTSFSEYFPDANTKLIRESLPRAEGERVERYTTAIGVAVRHLRDSDTETPFRSINLLPRRYTASSFRFPVEWSVPVLLGLIGLTTLGFVWYYVANVQAIGERQSKLQALSDQIEQVDQPALERRVETIETTASRYEKGLKTIDDLLDGSNKWSRQLAALTSSVNKITGLSIRQWRSNGAAVTLTGRANDRTKVVDLVRQLDGQIGALSFTEVRDVSLYDFKVTVPLDTAEPEVVKYWKTHQETRRAAASTQTTDGSESTTVQTVEETENSTERPASSGPATPSEIGPWTIVVASLVDREAAETVENEFQSRLSGTGHRIRVHYSLENSRYRVGVGAFDSRARALHVLNGLKDELPPDAWIHDRIPPAGEAPVTAVSSTE